MDPVYILCRRRLPNDVGVLVMDEVGGTILIPMVHRRDRLCVPPLNSVSDGILGGSLIQSPMYLGRWGLLFVAQLHCFAPRASPQSELAVLGPRER